MSSRSRSRSPSPLRSRSSGSSGYRRRSRSPSPLRSRSSGSSEYRRRSRSRERSRRRSSGSSGSCSRSRSPLRRRSSGSSGYRRRLSSPSPQYESLHKTLKNLVFYAGSFVTRADCWTDNTPSDIWLSIEISVCGGDGLSPPRKIDYFQIYDSKFGDFLESKLENCQEGSRLYESYGHIINAIKQRKSVIQV